MDLRGNMLLLNLAAIVTLVVALVVRALLRVWHVESDWARKGETLIQLGMIALAYAIGLCLSLMNEPRAVDVVTIIMAMAWIFPLLQFIDWLKEVRKREANLRQRTEQFKIEHRVQPAIDPR